MTEEPLPAWSLPTDAVERIALPEAWPGEVTREWAWGGATGAGVRVCILDSGVEPDHPRVGEVQESVAISLDGDEVIVDKKDTAGDLCGHGPACAGVAVLKSSTIVSPGSTSRRTGWRALGSDGKGSGSGSSRRQRLASTTA